VADVLLSVRGATKRFGALAATDGVDLDLRSGEIHALIGPNGAGKTTLIHQITGELTPDEGTVHFRERDITRLPVHRRAMLGLARTYQITNIFEGFSVIENVSLAVQARSGHSFRFWRRAATIRELCEPAMEVLSLVGLADWADRPAASLSHGDQRKVAIAMALAMNPEVLLLDEPLAGMGPRSSRDLIDVLDGLRGTHALLLVEHDMDAVFSLADRISVLVYGRIIASGRPEAIREDPGVMEAYLGEDAEAKGTTCSP